MKFNRLSLSIVKSFRHVQIILIFPSQTSDSWHSKCHPKHFEWFYFGSIVWDPVEKSPLNWIENRAIEWYLEKLESLFTILTNNFLLKSILARPLYFASNCDWKNTSEHWEWFCSGDIIWRSIEAWTSYEELFKIE